MKTERKIFIAFILNLIFSVFEFVGGILSGSVAIASDAVHDIGDAISIGISYTLEKKSRKQPDTKYTYGYARYSIIGGLITISILLFGSVAIIYNSITRIIDPVEINYDSMIVFAIIGVCVNFCAAFLTRKGDSINQRAVNLHMLEDVLGWVVVLIGAIVMKFTGFAIIDPLMSIGVAVFILINAIKALGEIINIFLEKTPQGINVNDIENHIRNIEGVIDIHHLHIWTLDGKNNYATAHIVSNSDPHEIKEKVREEMHEHNIGHVTLELETENEHCSEKHCYVEFKDTCAHHHHHHHH